MKDLQGVYNSFSLKERRKIAREMIVDSMHYGREYVRLPKENLRSLDDNGKAQDLIAAYRNKDFCVQHYKNGNWERLSINRTIYNPEKDCWLGNISWDELMRIKEDVGFGDRDAIEIYPRTKDVVYITNMRHLFLIPDDKLDIIDCIWRKHND